MRLNLKATPNQYYRFALEFLSAFKPFNKLRDRQKDLLAQYLMYNDIYKDIPEEERFILIFSRGVKTKIMRNIKMTQPGVDTNLTLLRQMGFITEDGTIPEKFLFKVGSDINIKFTMNENK